MTHDASHSYTYDAENHITKVDGGSTATYGYDVDGRRVSRVVAGVETDYIYDLSGRVVADYGGGCGATCWRVGYVYLNGEAVAHYFGGTYFYVNDHLGSTRLLTAYPWPNSWSGIVECDDYYPFGELISCGGTSTTTHKFTGYERDAETGLDNAQARYNSSSLGRFMSPDPLGNFVADATNPQTWNLYPYVNNNPLAFIDPTGMGPQDCPGGDGGNDCGGLSSGGPPIIVTTICGLLCLGDLLTPPPDPSGCSPSCIVQPISGGSGGGGTKGSGACPLNSAGISSCIAAPPPQAPTSQQKYDQCMASFKNTVVGKVADFGSVLSFADDFVDTTKNWIEAISIKGVILGAFFRGANSAAGGTSIVTQVGKPLVKPAGALGVFTATMTDAAARTGCFYGANPQLNPYMTGNVPIFP